MEAFVITLREGVEAALIIGLVLAYLNRTGRGALNRWVFAGLGLAILASLLVALGFSRIGFDPENELYEGILYGVAAILVATLVFWMWRAGKGMKRHVEGRLASITTAENKWRGWGLLLFVFFMVVREGVETVLFFAALSLTSTSSLMAVIGGLAGLVAAIIFGVLFVRGSLRINLGLFFNVTSVVLLVLAVRLAAGSLHEFYEAGVIALPHVVEEGIEFLTSEMVSTVILVGLVVVPLLIMLTGQLLNPVTREANR